MPTTRLLPLDQYPLAAHFLHRHWAPNHVYTRDKALFDWTFHRQGFRHCDTYSFAVAEQDGRIVGVLGGIPFRFNDRGQERPAFWLANWKLRDEFRRGTTGLDLLNHFYAPPGQVTISFGINPIVARLYDAMHWQVMENIPRYFAVHPSRADEFARLLHLANPAWPAGKGLTLAGALLARPSRATSVVSHAPPDPAEWDQGSWAALRLELTGPVRDAAYLRWRYTEHPTFQYRFIQVPDAAEFVRSSDDGIKATLRHPERTRGGSGHEVQGQIPRGYARNDPSDIFHRTRVGRRPVTTRNDLSDIFRCMQVGERPVATPHDGYSAVTNSPPVRDAVRACTARVGLLVWRLETIRHKVGDELRDVASIGRLVEFLPTSPENAAQLLSHLWDALDAAGAFGCDCYLYHGKFGQWLADAGMHRLDDHPDGDAVPSRFQPLDSAGGRIRSAVSLRTPPVPVYPFAPDCTWYWTKSDSDQDRPN